MLNIANIEFARKRFEKVNNYYGAKGLAPQLSLLRIEETLVNGQGVYNFDLKKETGSLSVVESNLKRNDLFVTLALGVFLRVDNTAKPGVNQLMTYPLIKADATAAGIGFTTSDIESLYNGKLYVATGNTVNIADMPTMLFKKVGQAADAASQPVFDFKNDLCDMAEEIVFAGTQDHKIQVSFPTFAAADYSSSAAANTAGVSKICFTALGYRVVGGTEETYRTDSSNPYKGAI